MTPNQKAALSEGRGPLVVLLLRLRGGTVYAVGTESATITQRGVDTAPIQVAPGLVIDDVEAAIDPFGLAGETALTQARVTLTLPDSLTGAQGDYRQVGAASAELARLWPGDAWQDRSPMLMGTRISGVVLGVGGEPSTFTLEAARAQTSAVIGDAARTIGADFPAPVDVLGNALTGLDGVEYPQVHGSPYSSQGFKIGQIGADGYDRVIIAGHAWAAAGNVEAFADATSVGTFAVQAGSASSGAYAYIRSNVAKTFDTSAGAITIRPVYGGIAGRNGTDAARSLGDLLELWLDLSGLAVDCPRTQPAIDCLRSWPGGVYFDAETAAVGAIRDHIVSVAPLVEMQSASGVWFFYADMESPQVRGTLTEGQELIGRVGGVGLAEIEDIRNSVVVRYSFDEFTGEFVSSLAVDADNDAAAYVSAQLYGTLAADPIESSAIGDASTARRVGRSLIQRRAVQRRSTSWLVSDWAEVEPGEVYRVVVPSLGIDRNAVATVISGVVSRVVTLVVLDGAL